MQMKQEYIFTLSGASTVSKRFNPNALFAPDIGTGGLVPDFANIAVNYGFYRVLGYRYRFACVNLGTVPAVMYDLNSDNDPGAAAPVTRTANPLCGFKILSAAGGMDRCTLRRTVRVANVVGDKACEVADSFRSLVTGIPADTTWLGIGAQSLTGATLATGISVMGEITFFVQWTDRLMI
jgi:hypothetical protein